MARRDPSGDAALSARGIPLSLAALAAVVILLRLEVSAPPDTGTWTPGPLQGEVVHSLLGTPERVVAGTQDGAYVLSVNGETERIPGLPGPVHALAANGTETYAATDDGVYVLPEDGGPAGRDGLSGSLVRDLSASDSRLFAATDDGLYERSLYERVGDGCERTRPGPANAVLATRDGAVVGASEGLFRVDAAGRPERVWSGGAVESLARSGGDLWAGLRGESKLLVSVDSGRSWEPRDAGMRLETVNTLVADPRDPDRLFAGGSGLADGENLAGVMESEDGGESWSAEQNRLSNTHVYALATRREPLRLEVSLPPALGARSLDLPLETTRFYAGTNGSGVYTYRPTPRSLSLLSPLRPAARFAEPILAGAILLALVWFLYYGREPARKPGGRQSE